MSLKRTIAAIAAALLVLVWSSVALGHAELVTSDPAEGATITTPYTLRATFDEEVDPDPTRSSIVITNAAGAEVARGGVSADDHTMMTAELPELPPGTYTARFLAYTADDRFTERGRFTFNVGAAPTAAPTPTPSPNGGQGGQTGNSGDLLIALVVAAIGLAGIGTFIVMRMRR